VQFDALWTSTSNPSSTPETTKASTSNDCDICYNIDVDALCAKSQHYNVEQVVVESCDKAIGKENDGLNLEIKMLKQKVKVLKKQVKTQPSQGNYINMVNKLEKEKKLYPSLLLNNKKGIFITRRKKGQTLMRRLSIHEVSS
jgi:hypothetical protein